MYQSKIQLPINSQLQESIATLVGQSACVENNEQSALVTCLKQLLKVNNISNISVRVKQLMNENNSLKTQQSKPQTSTMTEKVFQDQLKRLNYVSGQQKQEIQKLTDKLNTQTKLNEQLQNDIQKQTRILSDYQYQVTELQLQNQQLQNSHNHQNQSIEQFEHQQPARDTSIFLQSLQDLEENNMILSKRLQQYESYVDKFGPELENVAQLKQQLEDYENYVIESKEQNQSIIVVEAERDGCYLQIEQIRQENDQINQQLQRKDQQIQDFISQISDLRMQNRQLDLSGIQKLEQKIDLQKQTVQQSEEEILNLKNQINHLKKDNTDQLQTHIQQLRDGQLQQGKLKDEIADLKKQVELLTKSSREKEQQNVQLHQQIGALQISNEELLSSMKKQADNNLVMNKTITQQNDNQQTAISQLRDNELKIKFEAQQVKTENIVLQRQMMELKNQCNGLQLENQQLKQNQIVKVQEPSNYQQLESGFQQQMSRVNSQVSALQKAVDDKHLQIILLNQKVAQMETSQEQQCETLVAITQTIQKYQDTCTKFEQLHGLVMKRTKERLDALDQHIANAIVENYEI